MIISKNDKIYTVNEQKTQWKLSINIGGVVVDYNVGKDICPTVAELKKYVSETVIF